MGLAERRRIAAIAKDVEEAQAQMREVAGYDLPLQLQLETFPEIPEILDGYDSYKGYCLPAIVNVFRSLLSDDLGRQAVKERISELPSLVFVCPSNWGFWSLTEMMAASPSRTSSPESLVSASFKILYLRP